MRKTATDGFFRTELAEQLADLDVDTIIVTGIGTDFCVAMTRPLAPWLVRVRAAEDGALWAPPASRPKSAAGRRDVAIPEAIVPELRAHLDEWSQDGADGRVFVGPQGATPRRGNFQAMWSKAVARAGVPRLHFHDLRHTGNTLAAEGASLRELMARMGHSSARAALIYQHATKDRERAIGAAISARIEAARAPGKGHGRDTADGSDREQGPPAGKRKRR